MADFLVLIAWMMGWFVTYVGTEKEIRPRLLDRIGLGVLLIPTWPAFLFMAIYESHEILREIYDDAEESDAEQEEIL